MVGLKGPRNLRSVLSGLDPISRLHLAYTSCLLVGFFPFMPGTFASLLTTGGFVLIFDRLTLVTQLVLWFFLVLSGVFSSNYLQRHHGWKDPSFIVLDEVAGQWIALLTLPPRPLYWMLAFIGFRLFDVFKPFGLKRFERMPGGWGVMMDDVMAGFYTAVVIHLGLGIGQWVRM